MGGGLSRARVDGGSFEGVSFGRGSFEGGGVDGGGVDGGGVIVREVPRAGVYDAPLLSRMQRAVAILPAYGLLHVDFGEIAGPAAGFSGGEWPGLYGEGRKQPAIANYLFFPQPPTMVSMTYVAAEPRARRAGS